MDKLAVEWARPKGLSDIESIHVLTRVLAEVGLIYGDVYDFTKYWSVYYTHNVIQRVT